VTRPGCPWALRPEDGGWQPSPLPPGLACSGSPFPQGIAGKRILDLGCGTGRDCYVCAAMVGEQGFVTGAGGHPQQAPTKRGRGGTHHNNVGAAKRGRCCLAASCASCISAAQGGATAGAAAPMPRQLLTGRAAASATHRPRHHPMAAPCTALATTPWQRHAPPSPPPHGSATHRPRHPPMPAAPRPTATLLCRRGHDPGPTGPGAQVPGPVGPAAGLCRPQHALHQGASAKHARAL